MALTSAWDNELLGTLPGATTDLVDQQVINVLRDFCRRSGAWIVEQQDNIVASTATYDYSAITSPADGEATMIHGLLIEGRWKYLADYIPVNGTTLTNFVYSHAPGQITFVPVPTESVTDGISIAVAYMPPVAPTANTIDDKFVSHWYEHILNGVKARMMAMPGKPWSNIQLAAMHERLYRSGIVTARNEVQRRFSKTETSWMFPRWA